MKKTLPYFAGFCYNILAMIHEESISNKLLVLFVLEKMEIPIKEELLASICSEDNDWIPYFDCRHAISELVKGGFISKMDSSSDPMLTLSEDGHTCLMHFHNDIPKSMRDIITEFTKSARLKYKKKQEFFCNYYRNADNTYTVEMKIMEVVSPILQIKCVTTQKQAISIYNSWNRKAPEVYKALYDILLD